MVAVPEAVEEDVDAADAVVVPAAVVVAIAADAAGRVEEGTKDSSRIN